MQLKKEINKIVLITSILLIIFSCKKESRENTILDKKINHKKVSDKGSIEFEFDFPDTVYIDKVYNGKIIYKGIFDTITTNVLEKVKGKDRYIIYSLALTTNIDNSFTDLKKIKLDTFGATDKRTIPFYDIKFKKLGINYIDGIINDHVIIDTLTPPIKPTDEVRYLEKEVRATHKVVVIEKPKSKQVKINIGNVPE